MNNLKNTYILPTDKPSKLHEFGNIWFNHKEPTECFRNYNIYITSDEEIKEGDWFLVELFKITGESDGFHIEKCTKLDDVWCNNFDVISTRHKDNCKKIILTTDLQLIADGVQAINDEFLEWFVKNPSCEEVEVLEGDFINGEYTFGKYRIGKMYYAEESKEEPKQETLEEAAEKYSEEAKRTQLEENFAFIDFINGAKWQQERSYSEEEIIQLLNFVSKEYNISNGIGWFHTHESIEDISSKEVLDKWFEQFKKK